MMPFLMHHTPVLASPKQWGRRLSVIALLLVSFLLLASCDATDTSSTDNSTPTVASLATKPTATQPAAPTATPTMKPKPTATNTPRPQPTNTPRPQPTATNTPAPSCQYQAVNNNPWCYNFQCCNTISSPPGNFCSYFNCIASFWNGNGYVEECQDGSYSKSGGISGSCSHHGGNLQPLLAP